MTKAEMRTEVDDLIRVVEDVMERLQTLKDELRNRPRQTHGKRTSVRIDAAIERYIHELHERYPTMPQHEIAKLAHTNQGRVSETLAGKRT